MIKSKEDIINYFNSGIKNNKETKIGVEHEKFIFNKFTNKRIDYSLISKMCVLEWGAGKDQSRGNGNLHRECDASFHSSKQIFS